MEIQVHAIILVVDKVLIDTVVEAVYLDSLHLLVANNDFERSVVLVILANDLSFINNIILVTNNITLGLLNGGFQGFGLFLNGAEQQGDLVAVLEEGVGVLGCDGSKMEGREDVMNERGAEERKKIVTEENIAEVLFLWFQISPARLE